MFQRLICLNIFFKKSIAEMLKIAKMLRFQAASDAIYQVQSEMVRSYSKKI